MTHPSTPRKPPCIEKTRTARPASGPDTTLNELKKETGRLRASIARCRVFIARLCNGKAA